MADGETGGGKFQVDAADVGDVGFGAETWSTGRSLLRGREGQPLYMYSYEVRIHARTNYPNLCMYVLRTGYSVRSMYTRYIKEIRTTV